ncbi:glycosyltransferase [Actinomyces wuliandei]|uniref:glycosyltransferase n=1 Tax=Actinomyces wuliandei TaxID=2057743 RepID=UPI000FD88A8D|nr:glycosyltransferase [Actinomyces wuliandei]
MISRGVSDAPNHDRTARYRASGGWRPLAELAIGGDVMMVLPTRPARLSPEALTDTARELSAQAVAAERAQGYQVALVVVIQYASSQERRLAESHGDALLALDDQHITTVVASRAGKIAALNTAFRLAAPTVRFVGWVDDDVELGQGTLTRLLQEIRRMPAPAAVGATKVPHRSPHRTSHALARAKGVMPSAMNYPHGCAMIVTADVIGRGIPERYASDDGWVCFQLLDPAADNALWRMRLVPVASVSYIVGGALSSTLRRLRRQRIGQLLLMAEAPAPVSRCYLHHCLLNGVSLLPITLREGRISTTTLERCLYSWVHVLSTLLLAGELALRGLLRLPLSGIGWGSPTTTDRNAVLTTRRNEK